MSTLLAATIVLVQRDTVDRPEPTELTRVIPSAREDATTTPRVSHQRLAIARELDTPEPTVKLTSTSVLDRRMENTVTSMPIAPTLRDLTSVENALNGPSPVTWESQTEELVVTDARRFAILHAEMDSRVRHLQMSAPRFQRIVHPITSLHLWFCRWAL